VKETIAELASDRRIQALLIAFSFGAFIEGAAGFGTPVAISAAMLIGLGFKPRQAAGIALIGNTAPVAFGALGTPLIALAKVTGMPLETLSAMVGRQLPFFSVLVPFWLVWAMAGFKGLREVWPACLTSGLSFAIVQFVISNYHGPWVVDIAGAIASILCLVLLLKFWRPRSNWRFDYEREAETDLQTKNPHRRSAHRRPHHAAHSSMMEMEVDPEVVFEEATPVDPMRKHSRREAFIAWMPWIILSVLVFTWGLPQVKTFLNGISDIKFPVP